MANDLLERGDVLRLVENYYYAPESTRKTLLDNMYLALKYMKGIDDAERK